MEWQKCSCCDEGKLVLLEGRLENKLLDGGRVYACATCDAPDKPQGQKTIIELSKENAQ